MLGDVYRMEASWRLSLIMFIKLVIKISFSEQEKSRKVKKNQSVTTFVKSNISESYIKAWAEGESP